MNDVKLTGNIKNVRTIEKGNWSITTASFTQYGIVGANGKRGCILATQLVFLDPDLINKVKEINADSEVMLHGKMVTNFDRRPNVKNEERRASYQQVEVTSIEVTNPVLV